MLVTIDRAGRIVIPKEIRDRLSLGPNAEIELTADGDEIRLSPRRVRGRSVTLGLDGLPLIEAVPGFVVTDADVQGWRDGDQR